MSEAIKTIQERIEKNKYSRESGLRAICARADLYQAEHGGPAIKFEWLRKVGDGRTKNPGFDRIAQLNKVLDILEKESADTSRSGMTVQASPKTQPVAASGKNSDEGQGG